MGCCGDSSDVQPIKINGREISGPGDEEFSGPVKNRSCRDVPCLILFVIVCAIGAAYVIVAFLNGDPDRLLRGFDSYGNVCGKENEPLVFDGTELANSGEDMTQYPLYDVVDEECVVSCDTTSQVKLGYKCHPKILNEDLGLFSRIWKTFQNFGEDLENSWEHILAITGIGLAFSIIVTLLLRFLTAIIVWITVILMVVLSIAVTIFAWVAYAREEEKDKKTGFLVGAIIATVVMVVILLVLFVMRKRILLVIQLFVEAGKAIAAMPLLLLQPIWTLLVLLLVVGLWAGSWIPILSSGDFVKDGSQVDLEMNKVISGMKWYHIFAFLWVTQFVLSCQSMVIAGAVATWYFMRDKSKMNSPIMVSMGRLIRYHMGSVAFGSLIIAIIQMIRLALKYLERQLNGSQNGLMKALCCCVQCCMSCFENFLKYLNRNAYIQIAIYGLGFCASAKKAFKIIVNNALRVTAINFVGDFVLFLLLVVVVAGTVAIGYFILDSNDDIYSKIPPLLVAGVTTYLIAYCFVSVYEMIVDTLFLCFCEDCEMNDGLEKPYFMSRGLMRFVENSKKAIEAYDHRKEEAKNNNEWAHQSIHSIQIPPDHQVPQSPAASLNPLPQNGSMSAGEKTGMTPLHPGYPPVSEPSSPSKMMTPPAD